MRQIAVGNMWSSLTSVVGRHRGLLELGYAVSRGKPPAEGAQDTHKSTYGNRHCPSSCKPGFGGCYPPPVS